MMNPVKNKTTTQIKKKSNTCILIPARLKSTRLPNKALLKLNGTTIIRTVFDKCESFGYDTIVVTDSEEIAHQVPWDNFIMTDSDYDNGTDRLMKRAIDAIWCNYDRYINVQGDNPEVTKEVVEAIDYGLVDCMAINAYTDLSEEEKKDKNAVKCIVTNNIIHWYTRANVPYGYKALGFHGYSKGASELWKQFKRYKEEKIEDVEQLRWIQNGVNLKGVYVDFKGIEVNTMEDYNKLAKSHNL